MDSLYDEADLYDLVAPRDEAMERFYTEAAGGPGQRTLDLACGSGRFTVPLAASGAQVTGVDLAPLMLAQARKALTTHGLEARLLHGDMRSLDLGESFDAIVIAANSLLHLHTEDELRRAFCSIRRHLAPKGILAFDIFVPSAHLLSLPADARQAMGQFEHPKLGQVTVEETIAYDPIAQISRSDWYWSTPTHRDFRHTRLELRQIYPQELPLLLELGGLKLADRFGDFDRAPLTSHTFRQVCLAVPG